MPGNTLGSGSGIPGSSKNVGNFTVAGVATRVVTVPPTDADWGPEPPPIGTIVFEAGVNGVILYVRVAAATWASTVLI